MLARARIEGRDVQVPRFKDSQTDTESVGEGDVEPGQIKLSGLEHSLGTSSIQVSV